MIYLPVANIVERLELRIEDMRAKLHNAGPGQVEISTSAANNISQELSDAITRIEELEGNLGVRLDVIERQQRSISALKGQITRLKNEVKKNS